MNYFVKSLRNVITLASTKKSMTFYTCDIRDVVLQIFIQNGPILKEEAMTIKESLQDSSLDQFRASDGWLDTWKNVYAIKERRVVCAAGDVAEEAITSRMERI